jgi:hypothetical protein
MSNLEDNLLNIKKINYENSVPKREIRDKLIKLVEEYLIKSERKIYGGTALNKYVKIYDDYEEPDYDVYTPEPKKDAVKFAHYLFGKGIKDISVSRGITQGTYKVFAFKIAAVDFSYLPKNMYNIIPFQKINKLCYTSPEYLKIDLLLEIANPQQSMYRWEKTLPRYLKLNKKYPLIDPKINPKTIFNKNAINLIPKIIENNKNVILTGIAAYRILVLKSKIKNIFLPNIPYLEILTQKPIEIMKTIIKLYGIENISIKHYNKFLKIIPSKFVILYKNQRLINIYYLEDKCFPYIEIDNNLISSYDYLELYFHAMVYQGKIIKNNNIENLSQNILFNLDQCRKKYLKQNNSNIITDKLFQSFNYNCYGVEKDAYRYYRKNIKKEAYNYKPKSKNIPNVDSGIIKNYLGEFRGDLNVKYIFYDGIIKY